MKGYLKHIAAHVGIMVLILTIFFGICFFLGGCKSQRPLVQVRELVVHDTLRNTRIEWRDRIRNVYTKGDTVFIHDSVAYVLHDSIEKKVEVQVHDSIPYEVPVEKPVRVRSGYDRFVSWGFWSLLVLILLAVGWRVVKAVYLRR